MNMPREDEAWIERARALLDRSTESLDATTPLAPQPRTSGGAGTSVRGRARGSSAQASPPLRDAVAVHRPRTVSTRCIESCPSARSHSAALQPADIDVLTGDDDALDLYENLDFYAWLDEQGGDSSG